MYAPPVVGNIKNNNIASYNEYCSSSIGRSWQLARKSRRRGRGQNVAETFVLIPMLQVTEAVEVTTSFCYSFVEIRIFDSDFGLEFRILDPSRVERRLTRDRYYALKLQPIDRARSQLSKTPRITFLLPIQAEISTIRWIWRGMSNAWHWMMVKQQGDELL